MLIVWCISGAKWFSFKKHCFSKRLASSCLDTSTPFMTFSTDTARPELTWDLMNDVECVEVTEGWSSQDAVAEVQVVDVHHTQVQELEEDTGESVSGFGLRNFFIFFFTLVHSPVRSGCTSPEKTVEPGSSLHHCFPAELPLERTASARRWASQDRGSSPMPGGRRGKCGGWDTDVKTRTFAKLLWLSKNRKPD